MSINTSIGLIGVALQSGKTAASAPTFTHGLTGGKVFQLDRTVENANVACGVRAGTDSYVGEIATGADFETYGYGDVLPLYFYAAMGAIVSAANEEEGATGTYKHVIKLGDVIPFLTFWGRIGNEYMRTDGCKIDTLSLEFEGNAPVDFGVTALGMGAEMGLTSIPGGGDPSCFDGYFVTTNGTFQLDTASDTPASAVVLSGSLELSNSCEAKRAAGHVMPDDVAEGKLTTSGAVTVQPDDLKLYRKLVTGSETGTVPTGDMVYGSFKWEFTHSKNPKMKLMVEGKHVPFTAEFPDVDPEGGAAEMEFSFEDIGITEAGGSPITVTIINETESYVSD